MKNAQVITCAHTQNRVVDSRDSMHGIRRRRECTDCGHRWSTIEMEVSRGTKGKTVAREYRARVKRAIYKYLSERFAELAESDTRGVKSLESGK